MSNIKIKNFEIESKEENKEYFEFEININLYKMLFKKVNGNFKSAIKENGTGKTFNIKFEIDKLEEINSFLTILYKFYKEKEILESIFIFGSTEKFFKKIPNLKKTFDLEKIVNSKIEIYDFRVSKNIFKNGTYIKEIFSKESIIENIEKTFKDNKEKNIKKLFKRLKKDNIEKPTNKEILMILKDLNILDEYFLSLKEIKEFYEIINKDY